MALELQILGIGQGMLIDGYGSRLLTLSKEIAMTTSWPLRAGFGVVFWLSPVIANAQWMSVIPRSQSGGYPSTFVAACNNMDEWSTVRSVTSSLGSWPADLMAGDDPTLATCFANMSAAGLQLTIEAAAFQPPPTPDGCGMGADCYNSLAPLLNRLIGLGAPSMRIRMQEPLSVGRQYGWNGRENDIVNETVIFMSLVRQNFPGIAISSVEAYPSNSASLLNWWMPALRNAALAAGVQPPDSFEVDYDRNAGGTWSEIISMGNQARSLGWSYGLIFGSPLDAGYDWAQTAWRRGYACQFFSCNPDLYVFESWEPFDPWLTVPETTSGTMTNTVKIFREAGYFPR